MGIDEPYAEGLLPRFALDARSLGGGDRNRLSASNFGTFPLSFGPWQWSNFELVTRPKAERLESLTVEVTLAPKQVLKGGQIRILVPARVICPACRGRGSVGTYQCWRCLSSSIVFFQ